MRRRVRRRVGSGRQPDGWYRGRGQGGKLFSSIGFIGGWEWNSGGGRLAVCEPLARGGGGLAWLIKEEEQLKKMKSHAGSYGDMRASEMRVGGPSTLEINSFTTNFLR